MEISFAESKAINNLVEAISWTLLHSIWQGIIAVAISYIVILYGARLRSGRKYQLLTLILFLFVAANAATFYLELNSETSINRNHLSPNTITEYLPHQSFTYPNSHKESYRSIRDIFIVFFDTNSTLIVLLWLILFTFKSLRVAGGIFYLHRIRNSQTVRVEEKWHKQLELLAKRLRMDQAILLTQSISIDTPIVHGIFKPMIILPLGFFTNLPFNEIEAVLLHELAHIKRKDYLANLIQSFVENVYFFNPAVYWISAQIRKEREYCCDDLAVSALENRSSFVNALVSFQGRRLSNKAQMVAFAKKPNQLLIRIKRLILTEQYKPLSAMEKIAVSLCIIVAAGLSMAIASSDKKENFKHQPVSVTTTLSPIKTNSPDYKTIITSDTSKVMSVQPDKILSDTIPELGEFADEILQARKQMEEAREKNHNLWKESAEAYQTWYDSRMRKIELRLRSDEFQKQQLNSKNLEQKAVNATTSSLSSAGEKQYNLTMALVKMQKAVVQRDSIRIKEQLETAKSLRAEYDKKLSVTSEKEQEAKLAYRQKVQEALVSDLLTQGIIESKTGLTFKLHNKFFLVNGKVLPDAIQDKFRSKYLENDWTEWRYNFEGKTGLFITGVRFPGE